MRDTGNRFAGGVLGTLVALVACNVASALDSLHEATIKSLVAQLAAPTPAQRANAAENLGYLRAYNAGNALIRTLEDESPEVRREACLSLAWCGDRDSIPTLLDTLADADWSVRQAAWVSLTNLSGMEFPFDSHAKVDTRDQQIRAWRDWWTSLPENGVSPDLLELLARPLDQDLSVNRPVSASTTYKGPASVLTDASQGDFWQTKNVPFPQHCTIDLGGDRTIGCVVVTQYGKGFRMTHCAVEVSEDGEVFREVWRRKELTATRLVVSFQPTEARYLRVVSYASERATYPTTFYSVSVFENERTGQNESPLLLGRERAMRAIGCLGGAREVPYLIQALEPYATRSAGSREEELMVEAGIRALGRLGGPQARTLLIRFLENPSWARYSADALGDHGGTPSAEALIHAYPSYAVTLDGKPPARFPADDQPKFEAVDRIYETPYMIALALSRFPFESESLCQELRGIAPLLVVNMASDFDGAMLYEEQAFQKVTAYLLERAGIRRDVCELAFEALGCSSGKVSSPHLSPQAIAALLERAKQGPGGTSLAASWLTAVCRDEDCTPRLIQLLAHENGWVRINAAKTLMFMDADSAAAPITSLLKKSSPEANHGFLGDYLFKEKEHQGQDEYNAQSPCWREAFTRALGRLGTNEHVPLLTSLLNDSRNVLEVQYSAATSLDQIGTPPAIGALVQAATKHPFHSIRLLAREALWKQGAKWDGGPDKAAVSAAAGGRTAEEEPGSQVEALVFIKGSNDMPNDFQIDIWRQTYSTTDSGPTYRLGENLYLLKPASSDGTIIPLTRFRSGYVADCEVSWDGEHVIFSRREETNPWWHIYELEVRTGQLKQLTDGPYHDVQPAYLPDGRIIFSSSRTGMRDEYHGYPATGLTVMNADGTDIHCIGFNLGRDNEPAILPDGNIVFSRLELFYSRLKTEITVQTVRPDGVMNQTLYGPERRDFWRQMTKLSGEKGWGEAPSRHRVLRLTQPQPLGDRRVLVATTGGPTVVGPGRLKEQTLARFQNMAVASPYPLDRDTALCSATARTKERSEVDLGLYTMDLKSGALELLYNDPARADFEARPIRKRTVPPVFPDTVDRDAYTGRLFCNSARTSREAITRERGKLVRVIEGQPVTGRHHTHTSTAGEAWKNHTGTHARVLGTLPLAADGSFFVEIPADRLVHFQVLDSDRRVVGNQLIWMYVRPGETRGCVGCHEAPDTTPDMVQSFPASVRHAPIKCLPTGGEFSYRGKVWQKGELDDQAEERTRTVNAVNLPGRW